MILFDKGRDAFAIVGGETEPAHFVALEVELFCRGLRIAPDVAAVGNVFGFNLTAWGWIHLVVGIIAFAVVAGLVAAKVILNPTGTLSVWTRSGVVFTTSARGPAGWLRGRLRLGLLRSCQAESRSMRRSRPTRTR